MKSKKVKHNEMERAVLVSVNEKQSLDEIVDEHLSELAFLAQTAGIETVEIFKQKLEKPDIRTFVGKGKLEEIIAFTKSNDIQVLIFDDDLTPSQLRNLERDVKLKIYDRSLLILDIFLQRAQTAQAKTQVELARYQYLLPRLTRMWTHLERQRGGTGTRGGAGEKEIETDRRILRNQINVLKGRLEKIEKQNAVQRKSRGTIVRVALVGYTNVGKSTLMTLLSKSNVKAEDKLFATVDATVRKVVFNTIPFLLSDTVGFIRKLPHHLIESFKSTLAEVKEADILLHVVDVAHPAHEDHIEVVKETLKDIGADDKPTIYVFNKVDLLEPSEEGDSPIESMKQYHKHRKSASDDIVFVSAEKKINIAELRDAIYEKVRKKHLTIFPNYLKDQTYY
ncbi:GTPase HflX [Fulvivirga lutea]|uniref:GTPase HflX n=1 Tax=Fulvivirga lutea TaxID=2810512 RepID=A0A974WFB4_9BACT|nr:GTPase HflX [Fulvivirga lutea]QSE97408.1 GTPase HflX [Fulvivirga lutea]